MLGQAPLGIVVCADVGREQHAGYWVQDCAAATQNILLACHALGLGAVWIGVYPRDERVLALREFLSLPATVTPLCAITIGRPAEHPAPVERFHPERIRANSGDRTLVEKRKRRPTPAVCAALWCCLDRGHGLQMYGDIVYTWPAVGAVDKWATPQACPLIHRPSIEQRRYGRAN